MFVFMLSTCTIWKWLMARVCMASPPMWAHCSAPTTPNTHYLSNPLIWLTVARLNCAPLMVFFFSLLFLSASTMTDTTAHLLLPANVTAWIRGINKHKKIMSHTSQLSRGWLLARLMFFYRTSHWKGCDVLTSKQCFCIFTSVTPPR